MEPCKGAKYSLYASHLKSAKTINTDFGTSYSLPRANGVFYKDTTLKLHTKRGNIFLLSLNNQDLTQITQTEDYESTPI
jgi:hypothetical protein